MKILSFLVKSFFFTYVLAVPVGQCYIMFGTFCVMTIRYSHYSNKLEKVKKPCSKSLLYDNLRCCQYEQEGHIFTIKLIATYLQSINNKTRPGKCLKALKNWCTTITNHNITITLTLRHFI